MFAYLWDLDCEEVLHQKSQHPLESINKPAHHILEMLQDYKESQDDDMLIVESNNLTMHTNFNI